MAHSHAHGHAHIPRGSEAALVARRTDSRRRMLIALAINLVMLVAGVVGGILTGSLALLADAGHVLSDVGAIGLGLLAGGLAARPGSSRRTFGLQRTEVLAALINGLTLVVAAVLIVFASLNRLGDPPEIDGLGVLLLGVGGLIGNALATVVLARGERADLNLEGVLRHSAADALGSMGVIVSGAVFLLTDWAPGISCYFDPSERRPLAPGTPASFFEPTRRVLPWHSTTHPRTSSRSRFGLIALPMMSRISE